MCIGVVLCFFRVTALIMLLGGAFIGVWILEGFWVRICVGIFMIQ